jgi:hypothetical protein
MRISLPIARFFRRLRPGEPPSLAREHPPPPLPEPEEPPPEPAPPAPDPQPPTPEPREWNIWELERLATQGAGSDGTRHEERAFLLLELRQFANAEGRLPLSFDPIVRESFGELVFSLN